MHFRLTNISHIIRLSITNYWPKMHNFVYLTLTKFHIEGLLF